MRRHKNEIGRGKCLSPHTMRMLCFVPLFKFAKRVCHSIKSYSLRIAGLVDEAREYRSEVAKGSRGPKPPGHPAPRPLGPLAPGPPAGVCRVLSFGDHISA
eukprot:CAMPEP_0172798428 /NCGR_PEP_ID=MMETSP1075-20121228/1163_1 /TAXON_ID=2916 /ORGANISM="Ceratium fusus, Strain PA161109" /LENGTH=100 /DNA_ID=CAMNT_0013635907 /DNA_START=415 /DNA_END=717 /DNA_ORIENTATION=-